MDGNWKLSFPHCMFPVSSSLPLLCTTNYPGVCPNQPEGKSAFCSDHLSIASERGYPTTIKDFAKYCGQVFGMLLFGN